MFLAWASRFIRPCRARVPVVPGSFLIFTGNRLSLPPTPSVHGMLCWSAWGHDSDTESHRIRGDIELPDSFRGATAEPGLPAGYTPRRDKVRRVEHRVPVPGYGDQVGEPGQGREPLHQP